MKACRPKRRHGFGRCRTTGQSIPFIALVIVILFGMVGLAVDVGNTYAEQRKAVNATNAAAIAGMEVYIQSGSGQVEDSVVASTIREALRSNGIKLDKVSYSAYYLQTNGELMPGCSQVGTCGGPAPTNVGYIRVDLEGKVDTFFARVVNQDQLPIGTDSFATHCPYGSGVYPIAVNQNTLHSDNSFRDPDPDLLLPQPIFGYINRGELRGFTWRRLYLSDFGANQSGFGWVNWRAANRDQNALIGMLSGDGNLTMGFEEVPLTEGTSPIPGWAVPANYPEKPHQLNVGDVLYGNAPYSNNESVKKLLQGHSVNRNSPDKGTVMILPIYDKASPSSGRDARYLVSGFGKFMLAGFGRDPLNDNRDYIDLIAMGAVDHSSACLTEPVQTGVIGLQGDISFLPEFATQEPPDQPIRFVVVLDVSGSMSWNFAGQGSRNGSGETIQCGFTELEGTTLEVDGCISAPHNHAWKVKEERRIYITREAIKSLVGMLNIPGNADYDPLFPKDEMALIAYNDQYLKGDRIQSRRFAGRSMTSFSSDKDELEQVTLELGAWIGGTSSGRSTPNDYITSGGTNSAAALVEASKLLGGQNRVTFNGRTFEYKTVVIFVTDGVPNVLYDPNDPFLAGAQNTDPTFFPVGSPCRCHGIGDLGLLSPGQLESHCEGRLMNINEVAECHINANVAVNPATAKVNTIGQVFDRGRWFDRPVTQMINASQSFLKGNGHEVYVIAISDFATTGLQDRVASSPAHYEQVRDPDRLQGAFADIFDRAKGEPCIANSATTQAVFQIPSGGTFVEQYNGERSRVELIPEGGGGAPITTDIKVDLSGRLSYRFENVPQGHYTLRAILWYQHAGDIPPEPRRYEGSTTMLLKETRDFGYQNKNITDLTVTDPVCPVS